MPSEWIDAGYDEAFGINGHALPEMPISSSKQYEEHLRLECLRLFYAPDKSAKEIVDGAKTFHLFVKKGDTL